MQVSILLRRGDALLVRPGVFKILEEFLNVPLTYSLIFFVRPLLAVLLGMPHGLITYNLITHNLDFFLIVCLRETYFSLSWELPVFL